ncbi:ABC-type transport system involved in cytochrome bd biosynthesis fused ATPase/permease subunit [Micromonospora jinlongensis]|uniref:ABC-type transport system involved in cytochrome bd biosynthesis fused ATPase/permease subunit n=1 Tax=Micromonospora jinlongensis TaxID=1287877 RepID=A0A7Y9WW67_9ACTN|nr:hypothetical protein [Micromonospora jinlongensis]NYH40329.1 ABC-type transport system involved in cytochrome bd biosynthesis fused ATPase/permease subunit [Micromonospora jinlongensis]
MATKDPHLDLAVMTAVRLVLQAEREQRRACRKAHLQAAAKIISLTLLTGLTMWAAVAGNADKPLWATLIVAAATALGALTALMSLINRRKR